MIYNIVLFVLIRLNTSEGFFLPSPLVLRKCGHAEIMTRGIKLSNTTPPQETTAATTQQSYDLEPLFAKEHQRIHCKALGGEIRKIKLENDSDGFLTKLSVPTFATFHVERSSNNNHAADITETKSKEYYNVNPKSKSLNGIVPGAFLVEDAIHPKDCESIIEACEKIGFGKFNAGKNNHGAMQILVTEQAAQAVGSHIFKHLDMDCCIHRIASSFPESIKDDTKYQVVGLNKRWRVYRYDAGGEEKFAPHIDAGFPPSTLSKDGTTLIWDALSNQEHQDSMIYTNDTVSRLTVLMYLNDDFEGGHTKFYSPMIHSKGQFEVIASIQPKTGSILLFPQAVGEEAVEYARQYWPLHEGSPVFKGRPKYVIRSDVLFSKAIDSDNQLVEKEK
jgi:hypothetical protein